MSAAEPFRVVGYGGSEVLHVRPRVAQNGSRYVLVAAIGATGGMKIEVWLTPEEARKTAAAILDHADAIEGRTPLVFQPDCPKCVAEYPPGHPSRATPA